MTKTEETKHHGDLLRELLEKRSSNPPELLYHYTRAGGLLGIVQGHSIWATDIRYLNDGNEFRYGSGLVKQVSADLTTGARMGITGTPAFVLGLTDPKDPNKANVTQFISGAQSLEKFSLTIEDLLNEAEKEAEGP